MAVATVSEDFFDVLGAPAARGVVPRLQGGDPRAVIYDFDVLGIARGDSPVVAVVSDVKHEGLEAASVVPARRAARLDPLTALRAE